MTFYKTACGLKLLTKESQRSMLEGLTMTKGIETTGKAILHRWIDDERSSWAKGKRFLS